MTGFLQSQFCSCFIEKENHVRNLNVFKSLSLLKEVKRAVLLFLTHLDVLGPWRYIVEKGMVVL